MCLVGAVTRNVSVARAGMAGSAIITSILAVGISLGLLNVWIDFVHSMGPNQFWELLLRHPTVYPLDLVIIATAPPSPFLAFLLLSVSVKDFTMCAQPLRVPLEDQVTVKPREA